MLSDHKANHSNKTTGDGKHTNTGRIGTDRLMNVYISGDWVVRLNGVSDSGGGQADM